MLGLKTFVAGLFLGSVTSLVAMQIHIVNTNDGLIVLPRSHRPPISSTYVDVRKWSMAMWRQHPEVAEAALKSGRFDLLGDGALNSIFPTQADAETVPASQLATDKAKLAMEALVPIKFTTPEGNQKVLSPKVPDPNFVQEVFPQSLFGDRQPEKNALSGAEINVTPDREIFPRNFQLDDTILKGLPKLQRPLPIFDEILPGREPASSGQTHSESVAPHSDLFTDVLKALIPPTAKEQASTFPSLQHSVAHPAFRIEAPVPNSQSNQGKAWEINQQAPIPVVRPF